jgi:predicted nucleotidyltransferase
MRRPEIVEMIKDKLHKETSYATAILYGSEARGDAKEDSDIDVLILLDKDKISLKDRQEITYPLYDIELKTGVIISPKVFSKKHWESRMSMTPFFQNVMREGIIL